MYSGGLWLAVTITPAAAASSFTAKATNGANHVRVTLDPSDTYTVTFYKIGKGALSVKEIKAIPMVDAGSLRRLFTAETGLDLSL